MRQGYIRIGVKVKNAKEYDRLIVELREHFANERMMEGRDVWVDDVRPLGKEEKDEL